MFPKLFCSLGLSEELKKKKNTDGCLPPPDIVILTGLGVKPRHCFFFFFKKKSSPDDFSVQQSVGTMVISYFNHFSQSPSVFYLIIGEQILP